MKVRDFISAFAVVFSLAILATVGLPIEENTYRTVSNNGQVMTIFFFLTIGMLGLWIMFIRLYYLTRKRNGAKLVDPSAEV